MTKQEFREFYQNKLIYLDGATGSNLQKAGMPTGVCPEQWILEHPDAILELQRAFVEAGTNIHRHLRQTGSSWRNTGWQSILLI